jgi:hypothetical protein
MPDLPDEADARVLADAPADDEPLTGEDRAAILAGLAEHGLGLTTSVEDIAAE